MSVTASGSERWIVGLNVVVLGLALVFFFGPGGIGGRWVRGALESRRQQSALREAWPELSKVGSVLLQGEGQTVVEFSDYECPYCRALAPSLEQLGRQNGINLIIVHSPLDYHAAAEGAAKAALCAEEQGRFPEIHRQLLSTEDWRTDTNWVREAALAGVADLPQFRVCLTSPDVHNRIQRGLAVAGAADDSGDPSDLQRFRSPARGFPTSVASAPSARTAKLSGLRDGQSIFVMSKGACCGL